MRHRTIIALFVFVSGLLVLGLLGPPFYYLAYETKYYDSFDVDTSGRLSLDLWRAMRQDHPRVRELSELNFERVANMIRLFDYFNCRNYSGLATVLQDPETFAYQISSFNYEFIGVDRTVEYLVIGDPEVSLGSSIFFLLIPKSAPDSPETFKIQLGPSHEHGAPVTEISMQIRSIGFVGMAAPQDGPSTMVAGFAGASSKLSYLHILAPEGAPETTKQIRAFGKENISRLICQSFYDDYVNLNAYLVTELVNKENVACPAYARGGVIHTPGLFQNFCDSERNPLTGEPILGGSYEACMAAFESVPLLEKDSFPYSSRANTMACRFLHYFGARANPEHHCKHLDVPSRDLTKEGKPVYGPCSDPELQENMEFAPLSR